MIHLKKLIMSLALLLTAATGAWAESTPIGLNVEYAVGDVITTNSTGDVYVWWGIYSTGGDNYEWVIKITSSVTPTISKLGIDESSGSITFDNDYGVYNMNGIIEANSYKIQCQGKVTGTTLEKVYVASGSGTLTDPYVFAPGSAPAASTATTVPITWDAATKTGTFTMPAGNVLLQVEYYEDPDLAWKGKIPEGGFDAYLGFFHPSALPTIKNPNALTGITYSSSNTEVATVDENTGVVTALKTGSTVITATFAGDDTYEAAAISYTLNINSPAIITLPTSTDEGGTVTLVAGAASEAHDGDNKIATNANLDRANTSRNIAVGDDGTIHVVYKNTESGAVMYKKSTDGVTFSEPVQVSAESGDECEVAVSSNGKVYVSYTTGSGGYIAYSADGSSFTSVRDGIGYANSIHLAVDGDYVYGIPQNGSEFYYSADGGQNYETHTGWTDYAYSDVLIDKSNNNVVVIKDKPSVVVRYSTDHGTTFTEELPVMNGANQLEVFFSTAAAGAGKVFISGTDGTIATVNYINATCTLTTIEKTENRSLCADEDENVIVGVEQNGSLYYELSTDGAQTFGEKVLVSEGSSANAALNHHDGSLLYLFTKGTDLYLATKTGVVSTETVIDNGDGTYTVMPGTEVTLIAKANDGYHVKSWSNEAEVNNVLKATQTLTVTGNLNINATFAENEYNITFVEGTNPDPENPEWTATPNPAKTKQTVTVTYTGQRKVMGVKAEKKGGAAGIVNPVVGQVIGSDGNNYDANATLPDGVTKVAMIAYVSGSNGLALALTDEDIYTWDNSAPYNNGKTAPEICSALNTSKAVTGGTWKLPSRDEWMQMFSANGGNDASYTGLNTALGNAGGTALVENDEYWSSSEVEGGDAWLVNLSDGNASWDTYGKHYSRYVRACLAF